MTNLFSDGRKHERSDRLRNYQMNTKHEAVFEFLGRARHIGTVLDYYWNAGVYFVQVDYNGAVQDIPVKNIRLLSPGF